MWDTIWGVIGIVLPLAFVAMLLWGESGYKWRPVFMYFIVMGGLPLLIVFYNPFSNLADWQLGLFGLLAGAAIVGIAYLFERESRSSNQ